jgi:hypothetical protein
MPMPDGLLPRRMTAHHRNRKIHLSQPLAFLGDHRLFDSLLGSRDFRLTITAPTFVDFIATAIILLRLTEYSALFLRITRFSQVLSFACLYIALTVS